MLHDDALLSVVATPMTLATRPLLVHHLDKHARTQQGFAGIYFEKILKGAAKVGHMENSCDRLCVTSPLMREEQIVPTYLYRRMNAHSIHRLLQGMQ